MLALASPLPTDAAGASTTAFLTVVYVSCIQRDAANPYSDEICLASFNI